MYVLHHYYNMGGQPEGIPPKAFAFVCVPLAVTPSMLLPTSPLDLKLQHSLCLLRPQSCCFSDFERDSNDYLYAHDVGPFTEQLPSTRGGLHGRKYTSVVRAGDWGYDVHSQPGFMYPA